MVASGEWSRMSEEPPDTGRYLVLSEFVLLGENRPLVVVERFVKTDTRRQRWTSKRMPPQFVAWAHLPLLPPWFGERTTKTEGA